MKDKIKKVFNTAKENVKNNKAAYLFGALALAAIGLQQRSAKEINAFLANEGLEEKYYDTGDTEVANS